jgi:heme/copper-type cytochrome/quinol oxidase subunit 2
VTDNSGAISTAWLKVQVNVRPVIKKPNNGQNPLWRYLALGAGILIAIIVTIMFLLFLRKKVRSSKGQKDDKPKTDHDDPKRNKSGNKVRKERAVEDGSDESSEDDEKST